MKILTIIGTRPEIIRLSRIIPLLDKRCEHYLVHTGQNFDSLLNNIFFDQLAIRLPNKYLGVDVDPADQIPVILSKSNQLIREIQPDKVLILGDTDSGLSAIMARRRGVPVYHMEAGNRCYDARVPEEANRLIIDHCSDVLLPYTERSRMHLRRENISENRITVTGNPINEVMKYYATQIDNSGIRKKLGLKEKKYILATFHRQENVDIKSRLHSIIKGLERSYQVLGIPVICSVHPRTRCRLKEFEIMPNSSAVRLTEPIGFFDFVSLQRDSFAVVTDSGTVQEESCIMGIPTVTIRDVTERPETVDCGSNVLVGVDPDRLLKELKMSDRRRGSWTPPKEYLVDGVSEIISDILFKGD